jgi:hypothetical protein
MSFFEKLQLMFKSEVKIKLPVGEIKLPRTTIPKKKSYMPIRTGFNQDEQQIKRSDGDFIPYGLSDNDVWLLEQFYSNED